MGFKYLFLPHKDTHQKAKLISWQGILSYVLIFILLQTSFSIIGFYKPGVLGTSSSITQTKIIELTNLERQKLGLPALVESSALNSAAKMKAANMFAENYWAHFAPSGKTPWDFILGAGYRFSFAGENLAKNFQNDNDVVTAWMASPSHKENLLNSKYKDIGIAVEDGIINGQKTTLVVQMFGTSTSVASLPSINTGGEKIEIPKEVVQAAPKLVESVHTQSVSMPAPLLNPYQVTKSFGVGVIFLIVVLLVIDFIVMKRRGVVRVGSHYLAHMAFLSASSVAILMGSPGKIL